MRYRFIQAEKALYPLLLLCRCLQVARSGYYAWEKRKICKRQQENEALLEQVKYVYQKSRKTYGSPRIWAELRFQGVLVGKHRIARLLRHAGLSAQSGSPIQRIYGRKRAGSIWPSLSTSFLVPWWAGQPAFIMILRWCFPLYSKRCSKDSQVQGFCITQTKALFTQAKTTSKNSYLLGFFVV